MDNASNNECSNNKREAISISMYPSVLFNVSATRVREIRALDWFYLIKKKKKIVNRKKFGNDVQFTIVVDQQGKTKRGIIKLGQFDQLLSTNRGGERRGVRAGRASQNKLMGIVGRNKQVKQNERESGSGGKC